MNADTGRIYERMADIIAAEGRGELIIRDRGIISQIPRITSEELDCADYAEPQQSGRPFRRDPATGLKLRP